MALSLFGESAGKAPKKKPVLPLPTLGAYVKPAPKEVKKVTSEPKRENRISGDILKPLSEEDRKKLFPRGPVSLKMLKNETKRI